MVPIMLQLLERCVVVTVGPLLNLFYISSFVTDEHPHSAGHEDLKKMRYTCYGV
jgi:hypothetical protein